MSGSAKISFEIGGNSVTLYFGMTSTAIFEQKSVEEVLRMEANGVKATGENVDRIKTLAYVIYGGMCNWADLNDELRPKFQEAYMITESILGPENEEIQLSIWEAWQNSQPVAKMLERLNPKPQESEAKKPTKKAQKKKHSQIDFDEIEAFAFGALGLRPKEFLAMTYRQYVNLCVGYKDVERKKDVVSRKIAYSIVQGWADPKTLPSIYKFWPIDGEPLPTVKIPSQRKLKKLDQLFRNLGAKK